MKIGVTAGTCSGGVAVTPLIFTDPAEPPAVRKPRPKVSVLLPLGSVVLIPVKVIVPSLAATTLLSRNDAELAKSLLPGTPANGLVVLNVPSVNCAGPRSRPRRSRGRCS